MNRWLPYLPHLRYHAHRLTHNREQAKELVQDIWVKLLARPDLWADKPEEELYPLLVTMLTNLQKDQFNKKRSSKRTMPGAWYWRLHTDPSQEYVVALGELGPIDDETLFRLLDPQNVSDRVRNHRWRKERKGDYL